MTRTVLLGDIAEVIDSLHQTPKYSNVGYPMVRVTDIKPGYLDTSTCLRVSAEVFEQFSKKHRPQKGDIVFSRVGSEGIPSYVNRGEDFCLGQNTVFLVPKIDARFLYYWLISPEGKKQISYKTTGSTQKTISLKSIKELKILLPDGDEQKKIADILGTIDEKIELNRKMNETLEQMGQALFRHYFIDNPDAENWGMGKLGDLTGINNESRSKDYPHSEIQYVDISSVSTGSIDKYEIVRLESAPSRAKRMVHDGDIIWATVRPNRRAYSLIMNSAKNTIVSTGFAVLSPKKDALGFVYYYTSSQSFTDYLTLHARGAAYPAVTASDFNSAPVAIPDAGILKDFNDLILPNMQIMGWLREEIQTLTTFRDTLLPHLIAGKVKV